jgi:hypothetical protein
VKAAVTEFIESIGTAWWTRDRWPTAGDRRQARRCGGPRTGLADGVDAVRLDDVGALSAIHVKQPGWAVELLATRLVSRPGVLAQDASGRPVDLESREHNLLELATSGAQEAPALYIQRLIPYLLMVMELTKRDPNGRPAQDHFSFRQEHPGPMPNLGETLLHGAATALRKLVQQDERGLQSQLDLLAVAQYDSAQMAGVPTAEPAGARSGPPRRCRIVPTA